MYGKIFSSCFTGSMYGRGADLFAVWAYVIANAVDGTVELNPDLVGATIGMAPERVRLTITELCEPDANSRSAAESGRRLAHENAFQYRVVNHAAYRALRNEDERRAYNRDKQREHRTKVKSVIDSQRQSAMSANTEARNRSKIQETHKNKSAPAALVLPEWLPAHAWEAFREHRSALRSRMTPKAESLLIAKLDRFRKEGYDPVAVINTSIERGWKSVFPPDENRAHAGGRKRSLVEQSLAASAARIAELGT